MCISVHVRTHTYIMWVSAYAMVLIAFCRRVWCALNAAPRLTLNPPSLVYSFLFFVLSFPSNRADQSSILKRSAAKSRIPSTCRWVYLYSFLFSVSLSLQRDQHVAYVGNNNICIYFVVLIFFFALYIYLYIYIYIYIYITAPTILIPRSVHLWRNPWKMLVQSIQPSFVVYVYTINQSFNDFLNRCTEFLIDYSFMKDKLLENLFEHDIKWYDIVAITLNCQLINIKRLKCLNTCDTRFKELINRVWILASHGYLFHCI